MNHHLLGGGSKNENINRNRNRNKNRNNQDVNVIVNIEDNDEIKQIVKNDIDVSDVDGDDDGDQPSCLKTESTGDYEVIIVDDNTSDIKFVNLTDKKLVVKAIVSRVKNNNQVDEKTVVANLKKNEIKIKTVQNAQPNSLCIISTEIVTEV